MIAEAETKVEPNRMRDDFLRVAKAFVWRRHRGCLHASSIAYIRTPSTHGVLSCQYLREDVGEEKYNHMSMQGSGAVSTEQPYSS